MADPAILSRAAEVASNAPATAPAVADDNLSEFSEYSYYSYDGVDDARKSKTAAAASMPSKPGAAAGGAPVPLDDYLYYSDSAPPSRASSHRASSPAQPQCSGPVGAPSSASVPAVAPAACSPRGSGGAALGNASARSTRASDSGRGDGSHRPRAPRNSTVSSVGDDEAGLGLGDEPRRTQVPLRSSAFEAAPSERESSLGKGIRGSAFEAGARETSAELAAPGDGAASGAARRSSCGDYGYSDRSYYDDYSAKPKAEGARGSKVGVWPSARPVPMGRMPIGVLCASHSAMRLPRAYSSLFRTVSHHTLLGDLPSHPPWRSPITPS